MSDWDERAHRAAESLDMEAIEATDPEDVQYGFREGARWQREALLSERAVERAAHGIHASHDRDEWDVEPPEVKAEYRDMALAALLAALEGGR